MASITVSISVLILRGVLIVTVRLDTDLRTSLTVKVSV